MYSDIQKDNKAQSSEESSIALETKFNLIFCRWFTASPRTMQCRSFLGFSFGKSEKLPTICCIQDAPHILDMLRCLSWDWNISHSQVVNNIRTSGKTASKDDRVLPATDRYIQHTVCIVRWFVLLRRQRLLLLLVWYVYAMVRGFGCFLFYA